MNPDHGDWNLTTIMKDKQNYCFEQNGAKIDIFNSQVEQFVRKQTNAGDPFFLYAFYSQMTHENFNSFKMVDTIYANFIRKLAPSLKDTILVFAGDHGPRYGSFAITALGRIEVKMPLVAMRIPDKLATTYPHLRMYLKANSDRLVTWYDMHQMLKDAANLKFEADGFENFKTGPVSPWRQLVPPSRSCVDADIDPPYCYCDDKIGMSLKEPLAKHACVLVVKYGKCTNSQVMVIV